MSTAPSTTAKNSGYGPVIIPCLLLLGVAALAVTRPSQVIEMNIWDFVIITCLLGGWAAWRTGQSIAATWRPYWQVVVYMIPFGLCVRWVHYALFEGRLFSWQYYLVDLAVVLSLASLGYRVVRARQMSRQYRWLYDKTGPFTWVRSNGAAPASG